MKPLCLCSTTTKNISLEQTFYSHHNGFGKLLCGKHSSQLNGSISFRCIQCNLCQFWKILVDLLNDIFEQRPLTQSECDPFPRWLIRVLSRIKVESANIEAGFHPSWTVQVTVANGLPTPIKNLCLAMNIPSG
jgi:hypothetical protein